MKKIWSNLGINVEEFNSSSKVIEEANLSYLVNKAPAYAFINGDYVRIKNSFATFKDSEEPVIFSKNGSLLTANYNILQNNEAFSLFDNFVNDNILKYETAGQLDNGATIFITAKFNDNINITNEEVIDKYLLLTNSHDGKSTVKALFTPIRVACKNTLVQAIKDSKNVFSIRHTKSVKQGLTEIKKLLIESNIYFENVEDIFKRFIDKKLNRNPKEYFEKIVSFNNIEELSTNKKNVVRELEYFYNFGVGMNNTDIIKQDSIYKVYQTINGYINHSKRYKDEENKFLSVNYGTAKNLNQFAFDLLQEELN